MTIRSIDTIYQAIIEEKINQPTLKSKLLNEDGSSSISTEQDLLDRLQTTSRVAIWKLMAYLFAVSAWSLENLWSIFKTEVETIKASAFVASLQWWTEKATLWQFGDDLSINPDNYSIYYETIDESKQLIEHAAAIESDGKVIIKVRRESTDILSDPEMTSFQSYISKLKVAGIRTEVWNFEADKLKLYFEIFYDPILGLPTIQSNVETAINNYIENIPFNSELSITSLIDDIQLVAGVKAVRYISGEGKSINDVYNNIENYYSAKAGYCEIDTVFPLSTTLNFVAKY